MSKVKILMILVIAIIFFVTTIVYVMKKRVKNVIYKVENINSIPVRKMGFYETCVKRGLDIVCAFSAIVVFSPLYLAVAILVKLKLGSPVLFTQDRPGLIGVDGKETVFKMYKFRTMTNETDENGKLLPDEVRLTKFGAWLRNTSLDELPEAFNILNGTMTLIGPRPQLVRDLVFMNATQRKRHTAKPGLSGLAQVNGRNAITWEEKFYWDLEYINNISFFQDVKVLFQTVKKAFIKQEGISQENMATAEDFGDYLLRTNQISREEYIKKQKISNEILSRQNTIITKELNDFRFSVSMCVYGGDNAEWFEDAVNSIINQSQSPDEILIVVDGPVPEKLDEIINKFSLLNIVRIIRLEKNVGHGNARRIGLENCKFELVALMDSDDIALEKRFEKEIAAFKKYPNLTIVGGHVSEFYDSPDKIVSKRKVKIMDDDIKRDLKRRCPMNQPTVMFKKSDIQNVGGYIDWYCNEDYYLWIRIAEAGLQFLNIDDCLVSMRVNQDSYKRRGGIKYFISEAKLQTLMYKNGLIGIITLVGNLFKRFCVQVMMPNSLRSVVFRLFARTK